ncbi:MAG: hypothetical protein HKN11_11195, partial [Rhizobiales bacterium]|nr:hypothetical protein [Hyphomicrobiales bacterium]
MLQTIDRSDDNTERQRELAPGVPSDALEHIDLGIMIVDAELRIEAINGQARRILDISGDFVQSGTTLEDIFRRNAGNGRYGAGDIEQQVRLRTDRAKRFEAQEFERTQPDGTTIHVKRTPLPKNRLLTVYSDVTAARKFER